MQISLNMRRVFCFWVATLFFAIGAFAADDTASHNGIGVDCNFIVGRIIRHSAKFTAPVPAYSVGFDANLVWQSCGTKPWQQMCGYPLTGVGLLYTDYRSKHIFGKCLGAYPNLQIPIVKGKSIEWTIRFGVGLAYVTKKYEAYPVFDTLNTAVSTHLNAFGVFMTDVRWHLNPHWDLQAGANLTHISNALYREPNLGVNMVGGHIGFRYFPCSSAPCRISTPLPELKNRWLVETRIGISHKEARAKGNPVEPAYIGSVYVSKRFKGKKKLFAGVDAAYHKDVYAFLINYGVEYGQEKQHAWDGGVFAGGEYIIGRLGLVGMVGVYYRQTFLDFDPVYQKMGGKYYLISREKGVGKELFLSAFLNTHGVVAEYAEFGMGIGF